MSFEAEFAVRFGEIDHARVVYYPRFFHIYHQAFEEWFDKALGVPYPELVVKDNLGFPSVKVESEFRRPLRYGDRVRVRVELEDVGTKSMTIKYTMTRVLDGLVVSTARVTTVCTNNDSFKSVDIPAVWRERFLRYMEEQHQSK